MNLGKDGCRDETSSSQPHPHGSASFTVLDLTVLTLNLHFSRAFLTFWFQSICFHDSLVPLNDTCSFNQSSFICLQNVSLPFFPHCVHEVCGQFHGKHIATTGYSYHLPEDLSIQSWPVDSGAINMDFQLPKRHCHLDVPPQHLSPIGLLCITQKLIKLTPNILCAFLICMLLFSVPCLKPLSPNSTCWNFSHIPESITNTVSSGNFFQCP